MGFQFPVESFIRSISLEIFKLLPYLDAHEPSPAIQNSSQLPPTLFSVGDAELVKVSGIWFKLGDVPCIFGEYSVEDAILLGDPIPESTECGWILFWPPTAEGPLTLDSWPFAAVELLIDVEPVMVHPVPLPICPGVGLVTGCWPFMPLPDGLLTVVTIADPLFAAVVIQVLFGIIVVAEEITVGIWLDVWCWALAPFSFESIEGTGKVVGDWNASDDVVVVQGVPEVLNEVAVELSLVFNWLPENDTLGDVLDLEADGGVLGCERIDPETALTSVDDGAWDGDVVVVMLVGDELEEVDEEIEEEQLELGDEQATL